MTPSGKKTILYLVLPFILFFCKKKEESKPDEILPEIRIDGFSGIMGIKPEDTLYIALKVTDNIKIKKVSVVIKNTESGAPSFSYEYNGESIQAWNLDTFYVAKDKDGTVLELAVAAFDIAGNQADKKYSIHVNSDGWYVKNPDKPYNLVYHSGFQSPYIPEDNELTVNRVNLGKLLFFDPILSKDSTVSCASCHKSSVSFSDPKPLSKGVRGQLGTRNSMPIVNLAWSNSFFWDGSAASLEAQARVPLTNPLEMDMTIEEAVRRLNAHPEYPQLFYDAYQRLPDEYSLLRAIAAFERTLVSTDTKFDKFFYQDQWSLFNDSEIRGYYLFMGSGNKVHCSSCHTGPNFTNGAFENNGLYSVYEDKGRFVVTRKETDKGKFKVPTLRNIALTAPYMHDGSLNTLEEVIEHYNSGGKGHPNQSSHIHQHSPMTDQEKQDLINFLKTLTDENFGKN